MAYQTQVPVRIPPVEVTTLATKMEAILPNTWLVHAYDIPVVGDGVVIYGPNRGSFGGPKYADITVDTEMSAVLVEWENCPDNATRKQIMDAVRASTKLTVVDVSKTE